MENGVQFGLIDPQAQALLTAVDSYRVREGVSDALQPAIEAPRAPHVPYQVGRRIFFRTQMKSIA
ncbi:hypothetical protein Pla144_16430 [Bythopirellula polymerisocia]|uniref:Uncharacterized protein n=1 Tax=Bythopirellula polymerisocia TaxID=2528003 RepID=A0A5C6CWW2_9BACT|nr:hypothetical protein Pla144_16430 [Bythopirellula polymerisocia]